MRKRTGCRIVLNLVTVVCGKDTAGSEGFGLAAAVSMGCPSSARSLLLFLCTNEYYVKRSS